MADFQVEFNYTLREFVELDRVQRKKRGWWYKLLRIICLLIGVCALAIAVFGLCRQPFSPVFVVLLLIGLLLVLLVGAGLEDYYSALISRRLALRAKGRVQLAFRENGVATSLGDVEGKYAYTAFVGLYRRRDRIYLYLDKRHALIVPLDRFTQGEPTCFADYISQKCGLPVQVIK